MRGLIYETDTGELYYDRDRISCTYALVVFAVLDNESSITYQDFVVI
ncbi:hypothetical protein QBK99_03745 [Corticibacterium sp. UT-5YL-CI-8]|nr:hypothetical protein [Tianweitania sp. UT-5YL-CI-8]